MKTRTVTMAIAGLMMTTLLMAQPNAPHRMDGKRAQEMEAQKVAYITTQLDLTSEESQVFWPVYNEFAKKHDALRKKGMQIMKGQVSIEETDDKQLEEMMDMRFKNREAEIALEKEYHSKFLKVLPTKKVAKLYKAEHDFKRDLLKKLKKGKHEHPMKPEERYPQPR